MSETTTYEAPDTAAVAAKAADDYRSETDDVLGEKMVLNMGPSHPATHGVLRLVLELDGEIIEKAEPHIGYLHRGDEKIAENMHYNQFVPYTDRLDYLAPLANNVAYACAVEKLMGWELPPRGQALRVLCCELARLSSHMLGVGVCAMDVGAMTVFLYTFAEREKIYNFCEQLTGARFTTSYTRVGGQIRDLPDGLMDDIRKFLDECSNSIDDISSLLDKNKIYLERMCNVGVIAKEDAISFGMTGPNLRACGVDRDLRKDSPYLGYEQYEFDVPIGENGDCYDRYLVRMEEMRQSIKILRQVLDTMPEGDINIVNAKSVLPDKERVMMSMEELIHHFIVSTQGIEAPVGEVYFAAENPKGELGFYINSKGGGVPYRLKIRAPSFVNLGICSQLLEGHMVSDIPAILGSLDFVMGECDR
ncbi:NADH dehydrogenase (quinone) subunit D [Akkermansiaceae bacterium]|nr:NADH dehydrogenase (quinone) subunit D [Akkermansiaceae bacterium]MDB4274189.1 NADH dehydrogenase (quinone) subunit D [Akkermansiaceae bacterium]MDB4434446.1 NADH dehydrogenase (quinone) subunit D [Akkermansiaceae bacterium]MDB4467286.1 NADH dehydrogenase (quinone) subunit D [Akkermansiaceae bacterium]MDB4570506.1 NADH dehydrogenase (quinone) subunit D [Akkermansiaceae bacterium]